MFELLALWVRFVCCSDFCCVSCLLVKFSVWFWCLILWVWLDFCARVWFNVVLECFKGLTLKVFRRVVWCDYLTGGGGWGVIG